MKRTLPTALFIALGLLVTGCGKKPAPAPHAKPKPLPAWYLNTPKDDAHYLYGVGSAEDRDSALKAALVDIVLQTRRLYRRAAIEFTKELETQGLKSTLSITLAL